MDHELLPSEFYSQSLIWSESWAESSLPLPFFEKALETHESLEGKDVLTHDIEHPSEQPLHKNEDSHWFCSNETHESLDTIPLHATDFIAGNIDPLPQVQTDEALLRIIELIVGVQRVEELGIDLPETREPEAQAQQQSQTQQPQPQIQHQPQNKAKPRVERGHFKCRARSCKEKFSSIAEREDHFQVHFTMSKSHKCKICGMLFVDESNRTKHESTHNKPRKRGNVSSIV
jgi:hypothetical protein